tara:strand:- start:1016 stop:1360 length:345 start_codon:yes stop_codon:yes gene_type:complete
MFEHPEAREKIKSIFKNISRFEEELVPKFRSCLKNNDPIALYVATKDQDDLMWIFEKDEISRMMGGDESLESVSEQLLADDGNNEGVVFVVLKKVGPIYAIRLEKEVLEEVFLN